MPSLHPRLLARLKAAPIRLSGWGLGVIARIVYRANGKVLRANGKILRKPLS